MILSRKCVQKPGQFLDVFDKASALSREPVCVCVCGGEWMGVEGPLC